MKNSYYNWLVVSLFLVLVGFLVCFIFWPYPDKDLGPNMVTAFLGVFLSGAITLALLKGQTKAESDKDRDVKLFEKKLATYAEFHQLLWKEQGQLDISKLREKCMGELVFHLNAEQIKELSNHLKALKDALRSNDSSKDLNDARCAITSLLKLDLVNDKNVVKIKDLAKLSFSLSSENEGKGYEDADAPVVVNSAATEPNKTEQITDNPIESMNSEAISLNNTFWHFAMWGEEQLVALSEGIYELNLVEYGEEWRTNLMRQVRKDDLVFLFRSGGPGYMGVFRAKGRRIFEFDEKTTETVNMFGESEQVITDKNQVTEDLRRSDIYESLDDGASLCSSLIVEPLAFARNGIGNPGGIYRRTISRYDHDYGLMQLARFMAIKDDDTNYNVFDNKPMGCNKELFEQILASGNIQPAPRDENGNWID